MTRRRIWRSSQRCGSYFARRMAFRRWWISCWRGRCNDHRWSRYRSSAIWRRSGARCSLSNLKKVKAGAACYGSRSGMRYWRLVFRRRRNSGIRCRTANFLHDCMEVGPRSATMHERRRRRLQAKPAQHGSCRIGAERREAALHMAARQAWRSRKLRASAPEQFAAPTLTDDQRYCRDAPAQQVKDLSGGDGAKKNLCQAGRLLARINRLPLSDSFARLLQDFLIPWITWYPLPDSVVSRSAKPQNGAALR